MLVLKRSRSSSNPSTWGLPGGRCDGDETPLKAALREAREELGGLPKAELRGRLRIRRTRSRPYEVFVCRVKARTRDRWTPRLSKEHVSYRWVRLEWLFARLDRLHPVLRTLCTKPEVMRAVCDVIERDRAFPSMPRRRRNQTVDIYAAGA